MDNEIKRIAVPLREEYYKRLSTPYSKGGKQFLFIEQFNAGSGNELLEKFWSPRSSSRLCFDLYSWMGSDPNYDAVEFERKLPGIISGGRQVSPNMAVFFESGEGLFFIESKYTETVLNRGYKKGLPEAYWNKNDAYKSAGGKLVGYPIIRRYHGYEDVMEAFVSFIDEIDAEAAKEEKRSWFDAKQETCHLLGIVLFALENKPTKPIHFFNVAANESYSDLSVLFCEKAEEMVGRILEEHAVASSFDYQLCGVDDFFGSFMLWDKKGYQSDRTVRELVSDRSRYEVPVIR